VAIILLVAMSFRIQSSRRAERQAAMHAREMAQQKIAVDGGEGAAKVDGGDDEQEASWVVNGTWKETRDAARQDALKNARVKVTAYFHSLKSGWTWSPSEFYIVQYLMRDLEPDQPLLKDNDKVIGKLVPVKIEGRYQILEEKNHFNFRGKDGKDDIRLMRRVWLKVGVSQDDLRDMAVQDSKFQRKEQEKRRIYNAEERMELAARILGCLVALLAVVAGYIRLDEITKGFYSGWLRLAAAGVLAVVGSGLWMSF
jgi:hypothetical protein